jgi:hypothetical protein
MMGQILAGFLGEFFGIIPNVFRTIWGQLILRPRRLTPLEKLQLRVKRQFSFIRRLQDKIAYTAGELMESERHIRSMQELLSQREKELADLVKRKKSLEFRLREVSPNKRKR